MRVWLLEGPEPSRPDLFTALVGPPQENASPPLHVERKPVGPDLTEEVRTGRPDVLVLCQPDGPPGPWLPTLLEAGPALVAVVCPGRAADYRALGERFPVHLVPHPPCPDGLRLAVHAAEAARCRRAAWQRQVEELQQRLDDRIVIERAKGVLARGYGLNEEQAYKRLRVLARQQRRPVREIAQNLMDAQNLLTPQGEGRPIRPSGRGGDVLVGR